MQFTIITRTNVIRVNAKNYTTVNKACEEVGIDALSITSDQDNYKPETIGARTGYRAQTRARQRPKVG